MKLEDADADDAVKCVICCRCPPTNIPSGVESNMKLFFLLSDLCQLDHERLGLVLKSCGDCDLNGSVPVCHCCLQKSVEGYALHKEILRLQRQLQEIRNSFQSFLRNEENLDLGERQLELCNSNDLHTIGVLPKSAVVAVDMIRQAIRKSQDVHVKIDEESSEEVDIKWEIYPDSDANVADLDSAPNVPNLYENPPPKKKNKRIRKGKGVLLGHKRKEKRRLIRQRQEENRKKSASKDPLIIVKTEDNKDTFFLETPEKYLGRELFNSEVPNSTNCGIEVHSSMRRVTRRSNKAVELKTAQNPIVEGISAVEEFVGNSSEPQKEGKSDSDWAPSDCDPVEGLNHEDNLTPSTAEEESDEDTCWTPHGKRKKPSKRSTSTSDSPPKKSKVPLDPSNSSEAKVRKRVRIRIRKCTRKGCTSTAIFASKRELAEHSRSHKDKEGYNCTVPECPNIFSSIRALEWHLRCSLHHDKDTFINMNSCRVCGELPNSSYFGKHVTDSTNPECAKQAVKCTYKDCTRGPAPTEAAMKYHLQLYHENPPIPAFECTVCGIRFWQKPHLKIHMASHKQERDHICDKCGATFKNSELLRSHINAVHLSKEPGGGKYRHPCSICKKVFNSSAHKTRHEKLHKEDKPYLCTICGKSFKIRDYLNIHVWSHDPERHLKYSTYKPKPMKEKRGKLPRVETITKPPEEQNVPEERSGENPVVTQNPSLELCQNESNTLRANDADGSAMNHLDTIVESTVSTNEINSIAGYSGSLGYALTNLGGYL